MPKHLKICNNCESEKSLDEFKDNQFAKDKKNIYCISCLGKMNRDSYERNFIKKTASEDKLVRKRRNYIRCKYKITYKEFENMMIEQNFRCAICGIHASDHKKTLHIDHCHSSGKVRGLLCHHCNIMIGMAKENTDNLLSAIEYLTQNK